MRRGPKVPQCLFKAFMETDNQECAKKLAPYLIAQEQNALKKEPSGTYQTYKHFSEYLFPLILIVQINIHFK